MNKNYSEKLQDLPKEFEEFNLKNVWIQTYVSNHYGNYYMPLFLSNTFKDYLHLQIYKIRSINQFLSWLVSF